MKVYEALGLEKGSYVQSRYPNMNGSPRRAQVTNVRNESVSQSGVLVDVVFDDGQKFSLDPFWIENQETIQP